MRVSPTSFGMLHLTSRKTRSHSILVQDLNDISGKTNANEQKVNYKNYQQSFGTTVHYEYSVYMYTSKSWQNKFIWDVICFTFYFF